MKKGQKFRSEKQIATIKEKARLSMSSQADLVVPWVEGLDNVSTSLPLIFTHHEIVMESVTRYFICRPSIPWPMYVFNDCVSLIDDCDTCLAKATVIDGTM